MSWRMSIWEWCFALAASAVAAGMLLYATAPYGVGVSSDSMFYLSSADNFARGKGFIDFKGDPLIDFPPLYSFLLGVLSWASGVSTFVWGRFLNAGVVALLILSTAMLLKRCFPKNPLWLVLGTLATSIFLPLYTLAANIATDPLYILLMLWFCLAAQSLLKSPSLRWLAIMTLLAAACAFLRWIGLAVVASQFILVWIAFRQQPRKAWLYAFITSGLAILPVVLWVIVRNVIFLGTWGRAGVEAGKVDILQNLQLSTARMLSWVAPNLAVTILLLVILFAVLLVLNRKADWKRWLTHLAHNPIMPVILITGIYFIAVTVTGYTADHLRTFDDRYQAPLYFFILVALFSSLDELVLSHLQGRLYTVGLLIIVGALSLWGIYRIRLLDDFVRTARERGVVAYNDYNTKKMVRSGLVVQLIKHPPSLDMPIYSNEPEAVYFFLRRPVRLSPVDPGGYYADPDNLANLYPDWPAEEAATLVWFKPNIKRNLYQPDDIEKIASLEKIYKRWDGEVYLARPER